MSDRWRNETKCKQLRGFAPVLWAPRVSTISDLSGPLAVWRSTRAVARRPTFPS
jgi:hypothetical protein